ncbi:ubiquitin carboxyl-terminal hydrolase [Anaeramoeba ignava]|uniref:Ubiquitin carboxyl-terminal hydrolase n=1 Tax=Anaeramoeba ignava TaxID=1746090 RepID=A0A9Q0L9U3_ANAIG|nr:ubiquitin carboxyl-terminal hydrolase [Anaeramoeba ignava]|eukprot:Anaeramoba_ignava/a350684_168.p1 GENE.a350684_168~~a350684_168.p1  ORF type:complete len:233 (+),score=62.90 a350684_168:19-717(+)
MSEKRWIPLESNPQVFNRFCKGLGLPTEKWSFSELFGVDPDLLSFAPTPVLAVLLLYPMSKNIKEFGKKQKIEIETKGQEVSKNLWYVKQNIGNACGTIGLIHAIMNNMQTINAQGFLKEFYDKTKDLNPEERAKLLEESDEIQDQHDKSSKEGDTTPPDPNERVEYHFISFVNVDDSIYEMDGRKAFPINHGKTSRLSFLQDAADVIKKKFMDLDPQEIHFTLNILAPSVF